MTAVFQRRCESCALRGARSALRLDQTSRLRLRLYRIALAEGDVVDVSQLFEMVGVIVMSSLDPIADVRLSIFTSHAVAAGRTSLMHAQLPLLGTRSPLAFFASIYRLEAIPPTSSARSVFRAALGTDRPIEARLASLGGERGLLWSYVAMHLMHTRGAA